MNTTPVCLAIDTPLSRGPPLWLLSRRGPQRLATMEHDLYFLINFPVEGAFEMKMGFITQIPPGTYPAAFAGAIVGRTTKDVASKKNSCGKFFEMVSGLSVETAIKHDTDEFVACVGTIAVERQPSGEGVRVVEFVRQDTK